MLNEKEFLSIDEIISEDTSQNSSIDKIDVSSLPLNVVLGESYEEYITLQEENEAQKQKNEELRTTIKTVKEEIEDRKNKLLAEMKEENTKIKAETSSLETELNTLLGKDNSVEEII